MKTAKEWYAEQLRNAQEGKASLQRDITKLQGKQGPTAGYHWRCLFGGEEGGRSGTVHDNKDKCDDNDTGILTGHFVSILGLGPTNNPQQKLKSVFCVAGDSITQTTFIERLKADNMRVKQQLADVQQRALHDKVMTS